MKGNVLVVGGAGYIGTVLVKHLLDKGYRVWCIDALIYKQNTNNFSFKNNKNYVFVKSDFRDEGVSKKIIKKVNHVIILAGLVGDPITKKYKKYSKKINSKGIKNFIKLCMRSSIKKMIFVSTCSNYGFISSNKMAGEDHLLKPLSLYAKSKVDAEKYILSFKNKTKVEPIILRFATAFGSSPRMRFDLTINQFIRELILNKKILIYDANTWRPYCHVKDFSYLIEKILKFNKSNLAFEIFNAGDKKNNYTKKQIINKIIKYIPEAKIEFQKHGEDPRNYRVNFSKVKKVLNFKANYSVEKGIFEIIQFLKKNKKFLKIKKEIFGNYKINPKSILS